jgi:hypothetical protein
MKDREFLQIEVRETPETLLVCAFAKAYFDGRAVDWDEFEEFLSKEYGASIVTESFNGFWQRIDFPTQEAWVRFWLTWG